MSAFSPTTTFGYSPQILDYKVFASSGTWIKPSFGEFVKVECWGGGGSGARVEVTGVGGAGITGGCGGMYVYRIFRISELPHNVSITIGSGGAAITPIYVNSNGNDAGDTSFGSFLFARGGSGGLLSAVGNIQYRLSGFNTQIDTTVYPTIFGVTTFFNSGYAGPTIAGKTIYAGGVGGGYVFVYNEYIEDYDITAGTVGTTQFGGAGGLGSYGASNAIDGSAPGGGGGAHLADPSTTYKSGAGARGECRVTVW